VLITSPQVAITSNRTTLQGERPCSEKRRRRRRRIYIKLNTHRQGNPSSSKISQ